MAYEDGPVGVGGWLTFFLVTLGIFSPLGTIISIAVIANNASLHAAFGDVARTLVRAEWALAAVICILCWFACYRFLKIFNPLTVWIGIVILWTLAILNGIGEPLIVSMISGVDLGLIWREGAADFIRPIGYATIWTLYLLLSKRVKNTYRAVEHRPDAAADVFS